jgi:hypothetical protein
MKPKIQKYIMSDTKQVFNELTAWMVVINQYGHVDYSQLFCTLDEAYGWAKDKAKKIADNMEMTLVDEKTVHIPFNVILRYKVEGRLARTVDPENKGLEFTCIARKLRYEE